jgi:LacI family transcriptional regulator, galactose operon repressor
MMTLEEIAALAKVSRSTVSRVINNDPNVNEQTRMRVKAVIEQINYHPNMAARRLAGGHTGVIGLLVPMGISTLFKDPFFSIIVQGVSSACNAANHSAMLWLAEPEYERRTVRQFLHSHVIDGAIIASMLIDDPLLKALIEGDLPFILIGRYPASSDISYVDVDNQNAAFDIVSYMVRIGYRRIATIAGPLNMIAGFDRLTGYEAAMRHYGLTVDEEMVVESDFSEQGGYLAMRKLLRCKPEAVFVASDTMAVGALRAAKEAGLRIPEDIGVTGFDDMPFAMSSDPPLTTMRQPIQRCGAVAARTLIDMIDHPSATHHHIILPTELVIRESCGSPN